MSNVIIAGMGQVGISIALALSKEGHNITMIEQDGRVIDSAENLDALVIKGNAASPSVLEGAYISSADFFIGATGSDETNMLAAAMAKSKGCKTIVRINGLDYMNEPVTTTKFKEIGIDVAVEALREFGRLYRGASSDLLWARGRAASADTPGEGGGSADAVADTSSGGCGASARGSVSNGPNPFVSA